MFINILKDEVVENGVISIWTYLETLDGVVVMRDNYHTVVYLNDLHGANVDFETVYD